MPAAMPASPPPSQQRLKGAASLDYTESALRELYQQFNNMPDSAKKKKLIRQVPSVPTVNTECKDTCSQRCFLGFAQFEKQPLHMCSVDSRTPFSRKHWRSRSLGGIIKVNLRGHFWNNSLFCNKSQKSQHEDTLFFFFTCNRGRCWEAKRKQRMKTTDRVLQPVHVEEKQLCWSEYLIMKMFLIDMSMTSSGWIIFHSWWQYINDGSLVGRSLQRLKKKNHCNSLTRSQYKPAYTDVVRNWPWSVKLYQFS